MSELNDHLHFLKPPLARTILGHIPGNRSKVRNLCAGSLLWSFIINNFSGLCAGFLAQSFKNPWDFLNDRSDFVMVMNDSGWAKLQGE
jgi:hypothetical protein